MTKSYCEKARIECPHLPQCLVECRYDLVKETRKIKPYPAIVPDDIEPVSDGWHKVGTLMMAGVLGMIVVCFALVFFTGVWVWSLLI